MRSPRNKRRAAIAAIITLTVALAFASCNRKTIYAHYNHTSIEGWERTDTLTFAVGPVANADRYCETIGLRTCSRYPFKELVLVIDQQILPKGTQHSDTLRCRLTDEEGNPLTKGFNFYESTFPFRTVSLGVGDSLTLRVHHCMKREILPGIADIGLTLERNEE